MTQQETFDMVVTALRKQNRKALSPHTQSCMYRAHDGTRCAVGHLVSDEEYTPEIEGYGVMGNPILKRLMKSKGHDLDLLESLQRVHDCRDVVVWEMEWEALAERLNLVYTKKENTNELS